MISENELKDFLNLKADEFEDPSFLEDDPLGVVHQINGKENQEIIAFLISTFAWGQRKSIINNAHHLINLLDGAPLDFIKDFHPLPPKSFTHRTFNTDDLNYFLETLQRFYTQDGGLETVFTDLIKQHGLQKALIAFHQRFFPEESPLRSRKHISNPYKGSAAKRINMFLRWMVRSKAKGVDLELWTNISPSILRIPLDVHTARSAEVLGLSNRKANDWKKLEEIHQHLDHFDPLDPCKYDFALFGISKLEDWGIWE